MSLLQTIRGEAAVLADNRDAVVALGLFNGWVFALSWGGAFDVPLPTQLASFAGNGLWLLSLIVCTLVLGIFYVSRPLCAHVVGRAMACLRLYGCKCHVLGRRRPCW